MSAAQQGSRVDALTTAEFLTLLWPPCEDDSYRGHINIWTLEGRKSNWFPLRQTCRAAETALTLARKANVYFGTALIDFEARKGIEAIENKGPVDVSAIRGTSATTSALFGLHADLDVGGPIHGKAHKNTKLPPTYEDALALIAEAIPLEPTVIIDSGHGIYPLWLFAEPWSLDTNEEREEAAALVWRLQQTIKKRAEARGWEIDGTADLARVLRLPGTYNRKLHPVPVRVIALNETQRYQTDSFDPYLIDAEYRSVVSEPVPLPDDLEPVNLDSLSIAPWIKKLIRDGNEWIEDEHAWRYGSRSQAVWRVVNEMVEAELPDTTIAAVLLDSRYKISENPLDKGRRARPFVAREIGKARKCQENKPPSPTFDFDEEITPPGKHGHAKSEESTSPRPDAAPTIRPIIKTSGRDPKDVAEDAIRAVQGANQPEPRLFVRGGALVRTRTTELGRPMVDVLDRDSLFHTLVDVAQWFRYDVRAKAWKPTGPPDDVIRYISGHHALPFPALVGITEAPIVRPDGTIITTAGYDPDTRLIYRPSPGLVVAAIPDAPSTADVAAARDTLIDLVHDFAFAEDGGDDKPSASRTNAYALLLTLVLRPAIDGAVPLAAINKNSPGAGATLLTEVFGIIAHGRVPGLTALPTEDTELEKRITTLLRDGEPINVFDNVDQALEHGSLSLVLTATEWAGRVLGRSETARYPNRAVWIANGVNLTLRGDIARRAYETRIVVDDTQPWRLEGGEQRFRHPKLMEWAEQYRGQLLGACLTLARNWYASGQPSPSTPTLGMFEDWCRVIGGVLETAGIGGFLGNLDALYHNVDAESPEWAAFLTAWFDRYGAAEVAAKQVETDLKGAPGSLLDTLPGELVSALNDPRRSFAHSLGQALTKRVERRYGERKLRIVRGGNAARGKWRVEVGLDIE